MQNTERRLKAAKEKMQVTYKGNNGRFLNPNYKYKEVVKRSISGPKRKQLST
jgi:hypothetical protein